MCEGEVAGVCDEWGSGLAEGAVDCADAQQFCYLGGCVDCVPQCEGKECGPDACGDTCGECEPNQVCINGNCPPPGSECDDGNSVDWDGCTGGKVSEFLVNEQTYSHQTGPAVGRLGGGRYIAAWSGTDQDGSDEGVFARIFPADGEPPEEEFQVNTYFEEDQEGPVIGSSGNGSFVIIWVSEDQDGQYDGIFGQVYEPDGTPLDGEFQVNSVSAGSQSEPAVAALPGGKFVATWSSVNQDGDGQGVFARMFEFGIGPDDVEHPVNTYTAGGQKEPAAAGLEDGRFIIAWWGEGPDGDAEIYARLFADGGEPEGQPFLVNSSVQLQQWGPKVTPLADGRFLVAWSQMSPPDIHGRLFAADGTPEGNQFQLNTFDLDNQLQPALAPLPGGGFAAVWNGKGDSDDDGIHGQLFLPDGSKSGAQFLINQYTEWSQTGAAAVHLGGGNFVVAWHSYKQDGNENGVFAQRFDADAKRLYK